jgi:hypothetical protein
MSQVGLMWRWVELAKSGPYVGGDEIETVDNY